MKLQHKAVGVRDLKVLDDEEGIVEAFVSVTNVKDLGGDIIEPGAYEETLKVRRPKILHGHDWLQPVARTLEAKELMPGDESLPQSIKDVNGGALYIKMQFNLDTQRGRETYSDVKFYGDDSEWSIGFSVPRGGSKYDKDKGVTRIKEIDLYEVSSVLVGMNQYTVTAAVKDALAELGAEAKITDAELEDLVVKVGRTLSKKNEGLIRDAYENLATVLSALDEDEATEGEKYLRTKGRFTPEGSFEDLHIRLADTVFDWAAAELGEWEAYFTWIEATFPDSVVTGTFEEDGSVSYRSFTYEETDDGIVLGDPKDVRVETVILPKGLKSVLAAKRAELKDSCGDAAGTSGDDDNEPEGDEQPTGTEVVNEDQEDEEARSSDEAPTGTEVVADEDQEETPPNEEPDDAPAPVGDVSEDPATRSASAELELMLMRAKQLKLVS